jgi:DNA-binding PadR family transcriptional regulator
MSTKTWKPHPLSTTIVEILERKGPLTDVELYDLLKETYGDVGFGSLNQTLMKMEIEGRVYVSALTKGKRRVELIGKKES